MASPKMTYLEKIKVEVNSFLAEKIKHDYLNPDKSLTLNLTIKEAEILISAGSMVRDMANSGKLKALHDNCKVISEKAEGDYLTLRDLIDRIVQSVEEKEN